MGGNGTRGTMEPVNDKPSFPQNTCITYKSFGGMVWNIRQKAKVAKRIEANPDHRILYRVTPYFKDNNLLAYGVQMEVLDLDDKSFFFNVFVYNRQPGFSIVYRNGDVYSESPLSFSVPKSGYDIYVIDKNTKRFHKKSCASVCDIKNKMFFAGKIQTIEEKYCKCEICIS